MSRGPSTFRVTDVKRLVHALEDAGKEVVRVDVEGGRIRIELKNDTGIDNHDISGNEANETSEWDEKYGKH